MKCIPVKTHIKPNKIGASFMVARNTLHMPISTRMTGLQRKTEEHGEYVSSVIIIITHREDTHIARQMRVLSSCEWKAREDKYDILLPTYWFKRWSWNSPHRRNPKIVARHIGHRKWWWWQQWWRVTSPYFSGNGTCSVAHLTGMGGLPQTDNYHNRPSVIALWGSGCDDGCRAIRSFSWTIDVWNCGITSPQLAS